MIKGKIPQDDITLINIYVPKTGAPKYVKQILIDIKGEINRNTILIGEFNMPLTSMDRSCRQKINKDTMALNDTLHQMDLIDIFRAFHLEAAEYTYFSSAHGMFSRTDHELGHKTSLNKFKKIETISSIFSDHNAMKLEMTRTLKNIDLEVE